MTHDHADDTRPVLVVNVKLPTKKGEIMSAEVHTEEHLWSCDVCRQSAFMAAIRALVNSLDTIEGGATIKVEVATNVH